MPCQPIVGRIRFAPLIKLYRPRGLNPVVDQREELPLLPFGNPIGFVTASRGGVYIKLMLLIIVWTAMSKG